VERGGNNGQRSLSVEARRVQGENVWMEELRSLRISIFFWRCGTQLSTSGAARRPLADCEPSGSGGRWLWFAVAARCLKRAEALK